LVGQPVILGFVVALVI